MGVRPDQWPPGSAGFRVIQSLIACAGLLLAPDPLYAQVPPTPIPAINPLIDSLDLPDPIVEELNTLCSGSPQSEGCTTALGNTVAGAIESVPPEVLGVLPEHDPNYQRSGFARRCGECGGKLPAPHCLFRQHVRIC